jgi:hypothetical protein
MRSDPSLLPQPYVGDLATADIFVVYLNPGLSTDDWKWDQDESFRDSRMRTIQQRNPTFEFLDPQFSCHPGSKWWAGILGATKRDGLASRMAAIEFYPYHSKRFANLSWQRALPSFRAASSFVNDNLVPRARLGDICLIIARGARFLKSDCAGETCVVYRGPQCRGAYLSPSTVGGRAISDWLARSDLGNVRRTARDQIT